MNSIMQINFSPKLCHLPIIWIPLLRRSLCSAFLLTIYDVSSVNGSAPLLPNNLRDPADYNSSTSPSLRTSFKIKNYR